MLITRLWREQPGDYFCVSTKSGAGKWQDHFFRRRDIEKVGPFLKEHRDKSIYFCPHGFSRPRRLKGNAVPPKLLWSDLDEADPRKVSIKPTIALESSPGRYVGLWLLNDTMDESLNRQLAYAIGADRSGWDFTQVLRFPGTINYKYQARPRVKTMWVDGPSYEIDYLRKKLGATRDAVGDASADYESDAASLYKKWERKLSRFTRENLMTRKRIEPGKRSEVLWRLGQELIEAGLTRDDAFVLLKASPWNKFKGRRNEDDQLLRELDKAVNNHLQGDRSSGDSDDDEGEPRRLLFRSMDEVEEEDIDWVYFPYLARGELTIVEGDPGLGKSYLMQMIGGHICDGKPLPNMLGSQKVQGRVVYFDLENSAGTVTKKRLVGMGVRHLENFIQCEEPFSIDDDDALELIYEYMEQARPTLVVFDTLNTYLGKADAFKGHEAQRAFVRFREIAKRFFTSVVVLRHLTKGGGGERALYRGQGNIAFAGLARVVISVGAMPQDPEVRAFAVTKINVAKPPPAMTFTIESAPGGRSRFVWGDQVDITADELLSTAKVGGDESHERGAAKKEATEFLRDALADGPKTSRELERMAESRSINIKTMAKAADDMGIVKKQKGFGPAKTSVWTLPPDKDNGQAHDPSDAEGLSSRRKTRASSR